MGRFNVSTKGRGVVANYEGSKAYRLSPELELYTAVCCASLQPKFYVSDVSDELDRIRSLVGRVSPEFVGKLAVYVREKMFLRSVPLVLVVELARIGKLRPEVVEGVIQRADEIVEILGYYQSANGREGEKKLNKLSNALKEGIKRVFESGRFDEYQYSKYSRGGEIKLRDALFLTHPKPKDKEQEELFRKIANNTLETPYTWEVLLSERGNNKDVWEELIDSNRLPYMATIRNLRNILNAGVSVKHIEKVCGYLSLPKAVRESKQLPFRYLSAYREVKEVDSSYTSYVLESLEEAIKISVENIRGFDLDTKVLIACDVSGSMQTPVSPRSKVQLFDIGIVLGMLLQSRCKAVVTGMFGTIFKVIQLPRTNILSNADEFHRREGEVGYNTNGHKVLQYLLSKNIEIDKIMMFTDCQMWCSDGDNPNSLLPQLWKQYKSMYPKAKLYLFDLVGYGNTPIDITQKDVYLIAGWSNSIFDILEALDNGESVIQTLMK